MGNCSSSSVNEERGMSEIRKISRQRGQEDTEETFSLLLLGTGNAGKSTVLKQLKTLHCVTKDYTQEELDDFRRHIHKNLLMFLMDLVDATEHLSPSLSREEALLTCVELDTPSLTPDLVAACKAMWDDSSIQLTRSSLPLPEGNPIYFMDHIDRISKPDYRPSEDDILRCRIVTSKVVQLRFMFNEAEFILIDVGGQRNQRRKWIHHFDDVNAVIFVTSLDEYDQVLAEDSLMNRSHESLSVFKSIAKSRFFRNTAIMLFLNKSDLLREKIKSVDLSVCFKDYKGGGDYDKAVDYFREKYLACASKYRPYTAEMYTHVTCALDKSQIKFVFESATRTVLTARLHNFGMV